MKQIPNIKEAVHDLHKLIREANQDFYVWVETDDDFKEPSWLIEVCFLRLLVVTEALELEEFRAMVNSEFSGFKNSEKGFSKVSVDSDGHTYSPVLARIRQFVRAIDAFFPLEDHAKITKDLLQIIRDIHYVSNSLVLFCP